MKLLVTKQACEAFLQVSFFRKDNDFERFIRQAQSFHIKPLMCDDFFQDLIQETPLRNYDLLLNGGSYSYQGRNYYFDGLKAVISFFAYARYIFLGHQCDTPFGVKEKNYQDGLQLSSSERKDTKTLYMQNAYTLWEDCKMYIERHSAQFPEWESCQTPCKKEKTKTKMRMTLVKQ